MITDYATSVRRPGVDLARHRAERRARLLGLPRCPDNRGELHRTTTSAYYDGRASAAENYEENTGVATGVEPTALTPVGDCAVRRSAHRGGGLRYVDLVPLPTAPGSTTK